MPVAIPFVIAAVAVAGTVMQTLSAVQQAKFQANVAKMNAKINEQNAERASFAAQVDAQDQDFQNRAIIGEEISKQAGSGLSLGSGSFALQRKNLAELSRQDAIRIRQAGDVEAHNFLVSAAQNRAEASLARKQGKNALVSGAIGVVGSVASGFAPGGGFSSLLSRGTSSGSVLNASADVTNFRRLG